MSISGYEPATVPAAPDQTAQPVLAATWTAHVVDSGAVQDELERLWIKLGAAHAAPATPLSSTAEEDRLRPPTSVLLRANTLNLIAVAHSAEVAERIERTIVHLTEFHPSRAIILVGDPSRGHVTSGMDVQVSLLEQNAKKDGPAVRFECIRIITGRTVADRLASSVAPLLVNELPGFLWWPGPVAGGGRLFEDLAGIADRVIVDSAGSQEPAAGLHLLAKLARSRRTVSVSDFSWARLAPWRQLIAQFFDQPEFQPCLDALHEITIGYEGSGAHGDGVTSALLAVGWLADRLGWTPDATMTWESDQWSTTLRPRRTSATPISLRLLPLGHDAPDCCLSHITLVAKGDAAGTFSVKRTRSGLMTTSETPTMPRVSRIVYTREQRDTELLGQEIRIFSHDHVYEKALAIAARLLAKGTSA